MATVEYTYEWYSDFLDRCQDAGHTFRTFDKRGDEGIWLRHDVDWSPENARRMAEIEANHDATATYFFLVRSVFYNALEPTELEHIRAISDMGHKVGLHFAPGPYFSARPDDKMLLQAIETDRAVLRSRLSELADVVAFHSPPFWVLGSTFEGVVHTYEPAFFDHIAYRSDSLGRWREERPFPNGIPDSVQILTHPALWGETDASPTQRVREVQRDILAKTDKSMMGSRLDWSAWDLET